MNVTLSQDEFNFIRNALNQAYYQLNTSDNLIVTDDADYAKGYKLDFSETENIIDEAICILDKSVSNHINDYP